MPVYEYEHAGEPCALGRVFEHRQSLTESPLTRCPSCGGSVVKIISRSNISAPRTHSELRDMGFTKLVRRDEGVYENVTARSGDSRYMLRDKPETIPNLSKTIAD